MTDYVQIKAEYIHLLTKDQAWQFRVVAKGILGTDLVCYCDVSADLIQLVSELEIMLNRTVRLETLENSEITRLLGTYYLTGSSGMETDSTISWADTDNFLDNLISEAKNLKSSDIHIESYEERCRVRIRIDGSMVERFLIKQEEYPALINKLKIMAKLDITEKRLPQDGRINFKKGLMHFDIRVSVLPTLFGEKAVLRLLTNDTVNITLEELGFSDTELNVYIQGAKRPSGILLISGPTGSGKTTTLYATLKMLNRETRNILTIEDPVEYTLEGINQVQLKESIGLSFSAALRTFLRQDPDVIMVGEIRDVETANMAIRAALTGHLVLSTIHTNSAWGTISRLVDMGVPAYLVANTLNTSVAQRLVRILCPHCKVAAPMEEGAYPIQFEPPERVDAQFIPGGCEHCFFTGYKGRQAIYEVLTMDQDLIAEIKKESMFIRDILKSKGIRTLAENAFRLFKEGYTSLDEVFPLLISN